MEPKLKCLLKVYWSEFECDGELHQKIANRDSAVISSQQQGNYFRAGVSHLTSGSCGLHLFYCKHSKSNVFSFCFLVVCVCVCVFFFFFFQWCCGVHFWTAGEQIHLEGDLTDVWEPVVPFEHNWSKSKHFSRLILKHVSNDLRNTTHTHQHRRLFFPADSKVVFFSPFMFKTPSVADMTHAAKLLNLLII